MKHISISLWITGKNPFKRLVPALVGISILIAGTLLQSCEDDEPAKSTSSLKISGVSIPASIDATVNGEVTITGKGFAVGDHIQLTSASVSGKTYTCTVSSVTGQSYSFPVPEEIATGFYKMTVSRGTESLPLGSFMLNIIIDINIPDVAGMTVKGVVYCDGVGVPNVVVSDGFEVTTTNGQGIYYLPSQKKCGYVFISIPGNYEVSNSMNTPQFFKKLATAPSSAERKDFSLIRTDNTKHVVVMMADWHLANRNDDLSQFSNGFLSDVNANISSYLPTNTKVYGLALGDMTWDLYWYDNKFALPQYVAQMNKINCPVFNTMGNHDNDPYCAGDWTAEDAYRTVLGPTYYSFNLGNIHYIVLDNTQYTNGGGSQGIEGDRKYNSVIVQDQINWLKKDLATIQDKNAPVIIAMHIPLYGNPTLDGNGNPKSNFAISNGSAFTSCLAGFTNVHVLSGHTHINYNVEFSPALMEHNTAALCATWWWTGKNGYAGNQICKDGSPGGYGVWEINDKDVKWYYKSIGYGKNYQFRSYDLNKTHITAAKYATASTDSKLAPYAGVYAASNTDNEVLINVWAYDSQWTIDVKENGTPLEVKRVEAKDPLHIISYEARRLNAGAEPTDAFNTDPTAHMFKVKASSPTSTLQITVTDRFGNTSTETMSRPKELTYQIK